MERAPYRPMIEGNSYHYPLNMNGSSWEYWRHRDSLRGEKLEAVVSVAASRTDRISVERQVVDQSDVTPMEVETSLLEVPWFPEEVAQKRKEKKMEVIRAEEAGKTAAPM